MLSRFDDFPIHQTPEPIAHPVTTDRNFYDRYWFNGFTPDQALYFGIALGLYPNREIMDCAFSVVHGGEQRSFHASRRAPSDRGKLEVGPFRVEIVEPMKTLRVTLAPNETGLSCTLTFEAATACIEEERQILRREKRVFADITRFTQFGRWSGEIGIEGTVIPIHRDQTYAIRDRSWGVRPVGEPATGGATPTSPPQVFFLWAPIQWDDLCTHVGIFEDSDGRQLHGDGKIVPRYPSAKNLPGIEDSGLRRMTGVAHELVYQPGTRRAQSGKIFMLDERGERKVISFEPILTFQMKGIGYRHPQWSHGVWKGELAAAGDRWRCGSLDPLAVENIHIQQLVRARMGEKLGYGIVEQLCIGPHAPSGFAGMLDGAR
jgi:hypothetical protein